MPFEVSWYLEGRVVLARVWEELTAKEAEQGCDALLGCLRVGRASVHIMADTLRLTKFPTSLPQVIAASRYLYHPSMGRLIVISARPTPIMRLTVSMMARVARIDVDFATSFAQSVQLLQRCDHSLSGLLDTPA